ncbi:MAG TPA: glycosyltransferase, partial [bacterium]|nr:glycosyltransferase [bacterium]
MSHKIAVCIPTYNEKENILAIAQAVRGALPTADILVVDDSSPDGTADIVRGFQQENPWMKLHVRKEKKGLGAAYIDGFQRLIEGGYDIIVQMDADFSHQP